MGKSINSSLFFSLIISKMKLNNSIIYLNPLDFYKKVISKGKREYTTSIENVFYFYVNMNGIKGVWSSEMNGTVEQLDENKISKSFSPFIRQEKLKSIKRRMWTNKLKFWKIN